MNDCTDSLMYNTSARVDTWKKSSSHDCYNQSHTEMFPVSTLLCGRCKFILKPRLWTNCFDICKIGEINARQLSGHIIKTC